MSSCRCQIDLSKLEKEKSHKIEAQLEDNAGIVIMHLSITGLDAPGCVSDLTVHQDDPAKRKAMVEAFSLKKTPKKIKECGWLQVFHLMFVEFPLHTRRAYLVSLNTC